MLEPIAPKPEPAAGQQQYEECIAEMTRELEVVRDLPALEQFRTQRKLPQALFDHFNAFLAAYERLIGFALEYSGDDKTIECKKGCSNCCIDLVRGISTPEIINIYNHVRRWDDCKQLFEYHRESAETFSQMLFEKVIPGEDPPGGDDQRIAETHVEYNRLNRPCGFLDQQTGCCRIYEVRPIACRYFFSLDPPETCSPLHVKYLNRCTRTMHLPQEIHQLLREISKRFDWNTLNYLSGAFCQFTAEIMRLKLVEVVPDDQWPPTDA